MGKQGWGGQTQKAVPNGRARRPCCRFARSGSGRSRVYITDFCRLFRTPADAPLVRVRAGVGRRIPQHGQGTATLGKKLAVIPELCSGCRLCELACAIEHFGVNNPKKSAVRVVVTYPHPVVRMPIVCSQCKVPACADACPVGALTRADGVVQLDQERCISCMKCVDACPFGAMFAHSDAPNPIKCDMCEGEPRCVSVCPKGAMRLVPEQALGESKRISNVLSYAHMKEIEFIEKGERKVIHYAEIGKEEL